MSSETAGSDFWVVEPEGTSMGTQWGPIQRKMGVYFGYFCLVIWLLLKRMTTMTVHRPQSGSKKMGSEQLVSYFDSLIFSGFHSHDTGLLI